MKQATFIRLEYPSSLRKGGYPLRDTHQGIPDVLKNHSSDGMARRALPFMPPISDGWFLTVMVSVLLLVFIVLSACAQTAQQVPQEDTSTFTLPENAPPEKKITLCEDGIKNQKEEGVDCGGPCKPCEVAGVSQEQLNALKSKHTKANKMTLLYTKNPQPVAVGGTVLFPVALYNGIVRPTTFKFGVKFANAKDRQTSLIPTDNDLLETWVTPESSKKNYSVDRMATEYTAFSFTIGPTLDGTTPTKPGVYSYYLVAYYYSPPMWSEYARQLIAVDVMPDINKE